MVYQHPDLEKALSFLFDFGMVEVSRTPNRVYLRGYGVQPFVYVAEKSPDNRRHFIGGYWVVDTLQDLEAAASNPDASAIEESDAPGGGKVVTVTDPNGFKVGFVYGQELRERDAPLLPLEKTAPISNTAVEKPRQGGTRRFQQAASPVHKVGHYGFMVPAEMFDTTLSFYRSLINLAPSDTVYNPVTGKDESCFCHIDLGREYSDHHVNISTSQTGLY